MLSNSRMPGRFFLLCLAAVLAACGGGGDSTPAPPAASGPYTINGVAQYESVPPSATSVGLNYAATTLRPIRGATVQLLGAGGAVLATTTTDAQGNYSVTLASSQPVTVRVRAELLRTGGSAGQFNFTVRDNTNGEALYVLDSGSFTPVASTTRDLRANSGWGGSAYTATRSAAPFAMLDVFYEAQQKIATAASNLALPPLRALWSVNNVPVDGSLTAGQIGTTFYMERATNDHVLYVLGAENSDTDEYDSHVIAHEFGHYVQAVVSRDDSVGGSHSDGDTLDMRVAFSEGFANGWSGVALANPRYSDSMFTQQQSGMVVDLSAPPAASSAGWYNESTVQYLVWTANQDAQVGFPAIFSALQALRTSPAFSSIHAFNVGLKAAAPGAAGIDTRAQQQRVFGTDAFGAGETNNGGLASALPVYKTHTAALGNSQTYCASGTDAWNNKLGHHVFVRFTLSNTGTRTLTLARNATNTRSTDPDFVLLTSNLTKTVADSITANVETLVISLPAGTHQIALSDYNLNAAGTSCLDFTVQ